MNSTAEVITALAALVGAVVWPLLLVVVLFMYRDSLREFMRNLSEFSVKAPGVEATAKRQQIEAAVAVGAAITKSHAGTAGDEKLQGTAAASAEASAALSDTRTQMAIHGSFGLWVDDRPDNNVYERRAFEALGMRFALARSTEEALAMLDRQTFDVVISDMGRPPDPRAGYTLLDQMRADGNSTPFVIYASSRDPEHQREAIKHGAVGATNSPTALIELVTQALGGRAQRTR